MKYVTGIVRFGVAYYFDKCGNETTNKKEARQYTLKQAHRWLWKMRRSSPSSSWGYWPL